MVQALENGQSFEGSVNVIFMRVASVVRGELPLFGRTPDSRPGD